MNISSAKITISFDVLPGGSISNVGISVPSKDIGTAFQETAVHIVQQLQCVNDTENTVHVNFPIGFQLE
jgi:outer membrane biosynthesis protein TonB